MATGAKKGFLERSRDSLGVAPELTQGHAALSFTERVRNFGSSFLSRLKAVRVGRPEADKLFIRYSQMSQAFARGDTVKLNKLVVPNTYSLLVEQLNKRKDRLRTDLEIVRQDRHRIMDCRIVDFDENTKAVQATARFRYRRRLALRDRHGNILGKDEPALQDVEEICVFEKKFGGGNEDYMYVARVDTKIVDTNN